jgi:hypothetical protein
MMNVHDQDSPSGHSVEQHDISRDDTPGNPPILPAKDHGVPAPHRPWVQDISNTLQAPRLPNLDPQNISHAQAWAGICIHIPGSPRMAEGDTIVFHWGLNRSSTRIMHAVGMNATVRVLCIAYSFVSHVQYGLVDVYFEVYRRGKKIGTSPATRVIVQRDPAKQRDTES